VEGVDEDIPWLAIAGACRPFGAADLSNASSWYFEDAIYSLPSGLT